MAKNDIGGVWRTIGGRRVFIKDGQDLASAMKESGKFKNNKTKESTKFNKEDEEFIQDLVKHYDEFDRGDLQGTIEARYGGYNQKADEILKEVDRRTYEKYKVDYDYGKNMPEGARFSKTLEESGVKTFADEIRENNKGYQTYLRDRYGTENEDVVSAGYKNKKDLYQEYKNEVIRNINEKRMQKGVTTLNEAYKKAFEEYKRKHPNTKLNLKQFIDMSEE